MKLSERMIKARKNKGLTVQAVSEAVQVDGETVSAWEAGTATPDAHEVARFCEALRVSADSLLFDKPPVSPVPPINLRPLTLWQTIGAVAFVDIFLGFLTFLLLVPR